MCKAGVNREQKSLDPLYFCQRTWVGKTVTQFSLDSFPTIIELYQAAVKRTGEALDPLVGPAQLKSKHHNFGLL